MGYTNLRTNLESKFADWLGEHQSIEKDIEDIEAAYAKLDEKRERLEKVELLLESAKVIMGEIAPGWNPKSVRPSRKFVSKLPFDSGEVTRMAFDVMREESREMRTVEIARLVVQRKGLDPKERDLVARVKTAIDASLRAKQGKFVDCTEGYGRKWFILPAGASKASSL
ncbi:hypothetical protein K3177_05015 [Qipengyuania sp. GH25]|uniref:DUF3164 family protein n=1 Tax=Qipengyuania pacifica TaxID=2860199 RepID=A0ABS7JCV7_9SPHN|nr:hypothetical protein [Qipengyuania aerophila]MBX7487867.1 hypothetical protein [Qipengyuania aerophila]